MKPFNFKQHQNCEIVGPPDPQILGRLFRVGRTPVVVSAPSSVEAQICARLRTKMEVIILGKSEGVGKPLDNQ